MLLSATTTTAWFRSSTRTEVLLYTVSAGQKKFLYFTKHVYKIFAEFLPRQTVEEEIDGIVTDEEFVGDVKHKAVSRVTFVVRIIFNKNVSDVSHILRQAEADKGHRDCNHHFCKFSLSLLLPLSFVEGSAHGYALLEALYFRVSMIEGFVRLASWK